MRLNIELIENHEHNCIKGLIASIAKWNKREYELAYVESWDFVVDYEMKGEYKIGNLGIPDTLNLDILKSFSGISLNYIDFDKNEENFMTILKRELERQQPIIIILNYCWCPWNKEVSEIIDMKDHGSLVIGFDEAGLNCLDYSPRYEKCTFPYENISKIDGYATVNIDPIFDISYQDIINRSIKLIESHDIFNTMRNYGKYMEEVFDPIKYLEAVDDNSWLPNVYQISLIAESRYLYSKALRSISVKYNVDSLLEIADRLESTKDIWTKVKGLLIKAYNTKDLRLSKRIAKYLYEIADFEEEIFRCLVSIIK